jgi:hypothetical protein
MSSTMRTGAIVRPFRELDRTDKVREIFSYARRGFTCKQIASRVGFPPETILSIAREEGISVISHPKTNKLKQADPVGFGEGIWDMPEHAQRAAHYQRFVSGIRELRGTNSEAEQLERISPQPAPSAEPAKVVSVPYGAPFNFLSPASAKTIISYVALRTGISAADIVGPRRTRDIVAARRIAIRLVHEHCAHLTFAGIGRVFHRDHTTILWSLGRLTHEGKSTETPTFPRYFTQPTENTLTA